ncbi:M48 family metallopeptidase [Streptomyces xanthophaeus]
MGASLRASRALVLLAGFYLLGLVLLAVLAAADYAAVTGLHGPAAVKVLIVSVVLSVPIVRGMFMLRTPKGEPPAGVPVTEAQEPALWQAVREIAQQVGTRAPDEIVLVDEVNAAVSEDARLLGLRSGTRRLYLGLPLMTGLDEMQLRAVLAHEMGHYANFDTRLTPLIARGRAQLIRTIEHFNDRAADKSPRSARGRRRRPRSGSPRARRPTRSTPPARARCTGPWPSSTRRTRSSTCGPPAPRPAARSSPPTSPRPASPGATPPRPRCASWAPWTRRTTST